MTRVLAFAFRNIARNRVRSFSLIALASVGVCALILIAAGYEFLFSSATAGSVESDGIFSSCGRKTPRTLPSTGTDTSP